MKSTLLSFAAFVFTAAGFAQAPVIAGDTMLCPEANGTAEVTNGITYDSYQWMTKPMFPSNAPYTAIPGATNPTFTYDQYNYSATYLKLAVTQLGDISYESNELFIDGWAFAGLTVLSEFDEEYASIGPNGELLLCQGATVTMTIQMPYQSNVKWYKDGELIAGASSPSFTTGAPGEYWVSGSPDVCPDFVSTSLPMTVGIDTSCSLSNPDTSRLAFALQPNPARNSVAFQSAQNVEKIEVYNVAGQRLMQAAPSATLGTIDVTTLPSGIYFVKAFSRAGSESVKLIKE